MCLYNNVDLSVHYAKLNLSNGQKSQHAVKVLKEITFEMNSFFSGLDTVNTVDMCTSNKPP